MDRHIGSMIVQHLDKAELTDEAATIFEKGKVETCNTSLVGKFSNQIHCSSTSSSHMVNLKAVNAKVPSSSVNLANQPLQTTLCSGAARIIYDTLPLTTPIFPSAAFRDTSLLNRGALGSVAFSRVPNGTVKTSSPPPHQNEFDVQLSGVCQRRFLMFDHSGSTRRMILHPAMMSELSALPRPRSQAAATDTIEPSARNIGGVKHNNFSKSLFNAHIAPVVTSFPYYESVQMPISAGMDSLSSASDNCEVPPSIIRMKTNDLDSSRELSCYSHENTEDLEALLSSDEDEVSSTGHSPSGLTRNNSLTVGPSNSEGYSICKVRSRKREREASMDDDTSSTATSGVKRVAKEVAFHKVALTDSRPDVVKGGLAFQDISLSRSARNDFTGLDELFVDEMSSSSSANNRSQPRKVTIHKQQLHQLPTEQSRREKIKSILRLLRGIIPGGESMDTAFVLDEAIQYVRTLQSEVQKLQARKLVEIPKHQQK